MLEGGDGTQQEDLIGQQVLPVLQYSQHRWHQPDQGNQWFKQLVCVFGQNDDILTSCTAGDVIAELSPG